MRGDRRLKFELDRQMIDKLADPIIHHRRNGIDHGLETPALRTAAGKPAQGKLTLSAAPGWRLGRKLTLLMMVVAFRLPLYATKRKKGFVSTEKGVWR